VPQQVARGSEADQQLGLVRDVDQAQREHLLDHFLGVVPEREQELVDLVTLVG